MYCGTPSVTTSIGAEGMHDNLPWNGVIEDDSTSFVKQAVKSYTDKSLWEASQQNGITIINNIYDKEKLGKLFIDTIICLQENLSEHRKQNFLGSLLQRETMQATKYMSKWIEEKHNK